MKFLLAAVNAKYIHSNLGVYSLKKYADTCLASAGAFGGVSIEIGEYTINQQTDEILGDIFRRKPDAVGFSCYIWNIACVRQLVRNLKKVLPQVRIWLGGPEVSYDAERVLEAEPAVTGIMTGEGEKTFARLAEAYGEANFSDGLSLKERLDSDVLPAEDRLVSEEVSFEERLAEIPGLVFRTSDGRQMATGAAELPEMDELPFPYEDLTELEHRIIYYESSRGCPFRCSYCLSSIDKQVRFRSLELVQRELDFFLEKRVPQVKFVDRTFNCDRNRALFIWRYLRDHDNGATNFHFEISADLIDREQLSVLEGMRPGLIQLEIGVQTTYGPTIREIRRTMDLERLKNAVSRIRGFGNIHQHLDLIAGLPYEGLERFRRSFDEVYAMEPDQLQLGFLKVLKGSYMAEKAEEYGILFHEEPPYEVLSTRWLSYEDILRLKAVEEMVEIYYNSGQFSVTLREMKRHWPSAFGMFEELAAFCEKEGLAGVNHSRLARYEILYRFLGEAYRDRLMCDLYLRENVKTRPSFARDQKPDRERIRGFFRREKENPRYLTEGYQDFDARQMASVAHLEVMEDGSMVLFDYMRRNPLNHNARAVRIGKSEGGEGT